MNSILFLINRDLKPENILVQSNPQKKKKTDALPILKIADFGLSKVGCVFDGVFFVLTNLYEYSSSLRCICMYKRHLWILSDVIIHI